MGVIGEEPLIVYEPKAPVVAVSELGNSSVDFSMWMWVKVEDYWTVWLRIRENIYKAFYRNGITIPFPQLDVHLASDSRPGNRKDAEGNIAPINSNVVNLK